MIYLHELLHTTIRTDAGDFETYTCPHPEHVSCVILAGEEYNPTDGDVYEGVFDHVSASKLCTRVDRGEWEAVDTDPDTLHGPDGVIE